MLRTHEKWGAEERAHQTPRLPEVAKNLRQHFINQVISQCCMLNLHAVSMSASYICFSTNGAPVPDIDNKHATARMPSSTFKLCLSLKWQRGNRKKFWESRSIFRYRQYRYYCHCKGNGDGDSFFFFFQVYWKFLNFRIAISFWVPTPVKEKRTYNQTLLLLQRRDPPLPHVWI